MSSCTLKHYRCSAEDLRVASGDGNALMMQLSVAEISYPVVMVLLWAASKATAETGMPRSRGSGRGLGQPACRYCASGTPPTASVAMVWVPELSTNTRRGVASADLLSSASTTARRSPNGFACTNRAGLHSSCCTAS